MSLDVTSHPHKPRADVASARPGQLWRLAAKELKETLRDRRTIVTLIVMPLIVYPILSLVFRTFLVSSLGAAGGTGPIRYRIAVQTDMSEEDLRKYLETMGQIADLATFRRPDPRSNQQQTRPGVSTKEADQPETNNLTEPQNENAAAQEKMAPDQSKEASSSPNDATTAEAIEPVEASLADHDWSWVPPETTDLEQLIYDDQADVVLELSVLMRGQRQVSNVRMFFNESDPMSRRAANYLRLQFERINRVVFQQMVRMTGNDARSVIRTTEVSISKADSKASNNFTAMIPLVLVLMTITGAVYPAIDLTAGERERGTLETLVAAPIPRMRILIAKLAAVLTVAVLTASLNVIGMLTTIWTFRLEKLLIGEAGLSVAMMFKIFGLLVLFAAFFSALLLVVTSFARSFKEAQAYLIPIILLSLGPGLLTLSPGLALSGPLAVCPMVNILLLARDVLQDNVAILPAGVAIFSTLLYGVLALSLAASIFGTDNILYGSGSSWREMLMRPMESSERAAPSVALLCMLLLFPVNFVLIGLMARLEPPISLRLVYTAAFTLFAFCLIPLWVAWHQRVRAKTGFGLGFPKIVYLIGGVILGISLWPLVMSMIAGWHEVIRLVSGEEASSVWHERIVEFSREQAELFRQASPALIVIALSIVPAFSEEFFFRGMLQRALLTRSRPVFAILFSAIAFGAFHTLSGSVAAFDRLIPTSAMGLVLGYLAYKSNSIWPGVVLHAVHNAVVAFLAYYQPQLSKIKGFPGENDAIPISWTVAAAVVTAIGLSIIFIGKSKQRATETAVQSG